MKIERMTEIETPNIQIGDRIHVGHYTTTCQTVTPKVRLIKSTGNALYVSLI